MTIPVVFRGSSGINVAMSNEADVLPASPTGEVTDYADTGNVIRVFEGSNELAYTKPTTAIVKGATVDISAKNVQNLVVNGDFRNGLSEWIGAENTPLNLRTEGNTIVYDSRPSGWNAVYNGSLNINSNDKTYIKTSLLSTVGGSFRVGCSSTGFSVTGTVPANVLTNISGVITHTSAGQYKTLLRTSITNATIKWGKTIHINLTATFGAGNEPTKEECDKIFGGYFEGTAPLSDVALS